MAGLCYNAGNENDRLKFSGKELDEEGGLYKYHFGWRDYDPELGRWYVVDPARQFASPYVGMGNNPIGYYDEDGRFVFILAGAIVGAYLSGALAQKEWEWNPSKWDWSNPSTYFYVLGGALGGGLYAGHLALGKAGLALGAKIGLGSGVAFSIYGGVSQYGDELNWNFGGTGSYKNGNVVTDVSYNRYKGGAGTNGGWNYDVSVNMYNTSGSGYGDPMPQYTTNSNTRSAFDNNYNNSNTFGFSASYNGETGFSLQHFSL